MKPEEVAQAVEQLDKIRKAIKDLTATNVMLSNAMDHITRKNTQHPLNIKVDGIDIADSIFRDKELLAGIVNSLKRKICYNEDRVDLLCGLVDKMLRPLNLQTKTS